MVGPDANKETSRMDMIWQWHNEGTCQVRVSLVERHWIAVGPALDCFWFANLQFGNISKEGEDSIFLDSFHGKYWTMHTTHMQEVLFGVSHTISAQLARNHARTSWTCFLIVRISTLNGKLCVALLNIQPYNSLCKIAFWVPTKSSVQAMLVPDTTYFASRKYSHHMGREKPDCKARQ